MYLTPCLLSSVSDHSGHWSWRLSGYNLSCHGINSTCHSQSQLSRTNTVNNLHILTSAWRVLTDRAFDPSRYVGLKEPSGNERVVRFKQVFQGCGGRMTSRGRLARRARRSGFGNAIPAGARRKTSSTNADAAVNTCCYASY